MDAFPQDIARANQLYKELITLNEERQKLVKSKSATGRVDYRIKGSIASMNTELTSLSKVVYLYQNDQISKKQYGHIKDKQVRIENVKKLKAQAEQLIAEINKSNVPGGGQDKQQTDANLLDMGEQIDSKYKKPERDIETGEFNNTQHMDEQQLLRQQQTMIKGQNEHLDQLGGIL